MKTEPDWTFRLATSEAEYAQIHRLNYRTFVEEIPQRPGHPSRSLRDGFHAENTYIICLKQERLIGMVAVRGRRPFSLDAKLADLDAYLPVGHSVCEIRLLAIQPEYRKSRVFSGLLTHVAAYCWKEGYSLAVISGTVRQLRLYGHLGFVPFGPRVGTSEALFQPMYVTSEAYQARRK